MPPRALDVQLGRLTALEDPVRRALYLFVTARGGDVSRDRAARGVGISRALAAFHLDKLVRHGLLVASYRRLGKRRGPGAGRPAKLYRRSGLQLQVSLPPREYELAARLFAGALIAAPRSIVARVRKAARALGARLAREVEGRRGPRRLEAVLRDHGYEPVRGTDGVLRLRNCPFDRLARDYRPLMCGMNQALLAGVARGLRLTGCTAVLDPRPGMCCVAFYRPDGSFSRMTTK